jgi:peptidoglycan/xylan/chitin deacetylase (PgdA/CDA1 family)
MNPSAPHPLSRPTLAILGFHHVGPPSPGGWDTWYYIPDQVFVSFLTYLRDHDWTVIDVATLVTGLDEPGSLPERAALLTFDDGVRLIMGCALQRLTEFGYPAVAFVPTDYIGGMNAFDEGSGEPPEAMCDWDDLRELERRGVSVQSHSSSHSRFSALDPAKREGEFTRSKGILESRLGTQVHIFAFPYGDVGTDSDAIFAALKQAGYRAACLYDGGLNHFPIANPFLLSRLTMGPETDLRSELGVAHLINAQL